MNKQLIPCLYLQAEKAVTGFGQRNLFGDGNVETLAKFYGDNGADELLVFDFSSADAEHDRAIGKIRDICQASEIPVIAAGGIYDRSDVQRMEQLGADGVQVATRFVTTKECDAHRRYKEAYLKAVKDEIAIVKSPVGMPGRAILNPLMKRVMLGEKIEHSSCHRCLAKCNPSQIPYCITDSLIAAVKGDIENGLIFCGANAWKAAKIETVEEVVASLFA